MSKGTILTCGYINFDGVAKELHKLGYDLVRLGKKDIDKLDTKAGNLYIKEGGMWNELLQEEIENFPTSINNEILYMFGVGGYPFAGDEILEEAYISLFFGNIAKANATYRYFVDAQKRHKFDAILLHTAEGPIYRTLIELGKKEGIPTFCCYNGSLADCSPLYTAHNFYNIADYYYLHGDYDLAWMEKRNIVLPQESMIKVGQPSFDEYYSRGKIKRNDIEEEIFLYSPTVIYTVVDLGNTYPMTILKLDMSDFAILQQLIPPSTDYRFFQAFAKYQKEVNSEARLLISQRPFFGTTEAGYTQYVKEIGVTNFEVFSNGRKSVRKLLKETKYVVSASSTVLVEAVINRKPLLNLTGFCDRGFFSQDGLSVDTKTNNIDDIIHAIIELTKSTDKLISNCEEYASYYNFKDDGRASKRLVKDMDKKIS